METCKNCIWLLKVNKHPWNKGEGKGTVSENMGYVCHDILADFPIDIFLLNSHSNYIKNKSLGKEAHRSRVALENLLSQNSSAEINDFYSAMAKIGLGRDITIFLGCEA